MTTPVSTPGRINFDRAEIEGSIIDRFARVVGSCAERTAIIGAEGEMSYRELDAKTNQLAHAILNRTRPGIGCVAFLADHSPEMIVCALAILKAAKAYLCIHAAMPPLAQAEVIADAAPDLLIVSARYRDTLREAADLGDIPLLCLDDIDPHGPDSAPGIAIQAQDPAVIFYTSGTTGRPKGVLKSHRMVLHRAWLAVEIDQIGVGDRHSLMTSCSFAASESDMFGVLLNGATVALYDIATRGLVRFGAWIDQHRITILHPPVVLFRRYLASLDGSRLHPSVRMIFLAGEAVTLADLQLWRERFALSCGLRHRFASTEAGSMAVTRIHPGERDLTALTRRPGPVIDKHLSIEIDGRPAPPGAEGELVVRSRFIADGYWRRPHSAESPFQPAPGAAGERSFRTGDIGRLFADGTFEFLGRRDNQVKIRGYRVELREVENAIQSHPTVKEAAVIADSLDDKSILTAFVVTMPGAAYQEKAMRSALLANLAPWKIPSRIHVVAELPLPRPARSTNNVSSMTRKGRPARRGNVPDRHPAEATRRARAEPVMAKQSRRAPRGDTLEIDSLVQHSIEAFDRLTAQAQQPNMPAREALGLADQLLAHGHPDTAGLIAQLRQHPHRDVVGLAGKLQRSFDQLRARFRLEEVDRKLIVRAYRREGYLLFESPRESSKLLVLFTTFYNNFYLSNLAMHAMLKDLGCHILLLKDNTLAHFQRGVAIFAKDFPGIADQIAATARRLGADKIYLSGFSSGGYPALLTALRMPCHGYLGFSQVTDLSPDTELQRPRYFTAGVLAKLDPRWLVDLRVLLEDADPVVPRFLVHGDRAKRDLDYARHLAGLDTIRLVRLRGASHNTIQYLLRSGRLTAAFRALVRDR